MARTQHDDLLPTLWKGFKYIEEKSFESTFQGLFSDKSAFGKAWQHAQNRNDKLCVIIKKSPMALPFSTDSDILVMLRVPDRPVRRCSGKRQASSIRRNNFSILSPLLPWTARSHPPAKRKTQPIYDFACGSVLCFEFRNQLGRRHRKIYGQEKNITTYNWRV